MSELVNVEPLVPGACAVTMNRPERRNALSMELVERLCETIAALAADPSQRVVIVRGAGPVFSAGLDLNEAADESLVERSAAAVERVLRLLRQTPLVTVASVQGGAFAGGAGLMAACDIVIAAADARFGFPEARRGLLPALICEVLRDKISDGNLRDLFLTGDSFDSSRAQQMGLVQRVVPRDQLPAESLRVARGILASGPATIRHTKQLLNETLRSFAGEATTRLADWHRQARHSAEAHEGLAAFLEKREPNWSQP